MSKKAHLLLDTCIFMEYQPITDIDWCSLSGCEEVVLYVAQVVWRELDNLKESGNKRRSRRAQAAHRLIGSMHYGNGELRDSVWLVMLESEPRRDRVPEHLDLSVNDDRIIATALEECKEGREFGIVTGDLGLKVKAEFNKIGVLNVPENLRLKESEDSISREPTPKLSVVYSSTGKLFKSVVVHNYEISDIDISNYATRTAIEEAKEYRGPALDEFRARTRHYIENLIRVAIARINTVKIDLVLRNQSDVNAEDMDLFLKVDSPFQLSESVPPLPERFWFKEVVDTGRELGIERESIQSWSIFDQHNARFKFERLKHGMQTTMPEIYLSKQDFSTLSGTQIYVSINTYNAKETTNQTLGLKITQGDRHLSGLDAIIEVLQPYCSEI